MTLKKVLNQWSTRNLTLIGKICIIKTLAISKLVYNTSVLSTPPDFPKQVNESCFKFIWNFKPDKIKRNTIIGPLDKGELNMIDFKMIDKALKAAWVKRLYDATPNSKWCSLFSSEMSRYGGPFLFECNFNAQDLNIAAHVPSFYKDVLNAWQELHSKNPSHTIEYMNEIIWNNRFIKIDKKPVFYSSWYKSGVTKISHLLDENNRFLSRSDFQQKYGLSVNFLMYNGLLAFKFRTTPYIKNGSNNNTDLTAANVTAKSARKQLVLSSLKAPNIETELVEKNLPFKAIYELPFKETIENKLRCFSFKIIHNILPSNSSLQKMKLKSSSSCDRCNHPHETLTHLLYECPIVQTFWQIKGHYFWNEKRSESVTLNVTDIIYGYKPESRPLFFRLQPLPPHCQASYFPMLVEQRLPLPRNISLNTERQDSL